MWFARLSIAALLLLPLLAACAGNGEAGADDARVLRIILVPAQGLDPASPDGLRHLARVSGVTWTHLRPSGGGGHVLVSEQALTPDQTREVIQRLEADTAVASVEEDRRITP